MMRISIGLGVLVVVLLGFLLKDDELLKDKGVDLMAEPVKIDPVKVSPLLTEPETKPELFVSESDTSKNKSPVDEVGEEWQASDKMLAPVLIKPPLIALADSDDFIRAALAPLFPGLNGMGFWEPENVLQRWVTLINEVADGHVLFKHRWFLTANSSFPVIETENGLLLDPEGYHRFDQMVAAFTDADIDTAMVFLNENKALMDIVFQQFSHSDGFTLNKLFLKSIDMVLAAPIITDDMLVIKKMDRYYFANPDIEGLSGIAKQMIRLGPNNTRSIQDKLKLFKARLLELAR